MDESRGIIRNRQYATQIRDFSGMRFGSITPTDIDGYIEYRGRCHVLIELKYGEARLPYGQKLALERLCDDLEQAKPTLAIIASHTCVGDIDVAGATVTETRFHGKWYPREDGASVREMTERFIDWVKKATGQA